jgi:hypothetical protein
MLKLNFAWKVTLFLTTACFASSWAYSTADEEMPAPTKATKSPGKSVKTKTATAERMGPPVPAGMQETRVTASGDDGESKYEIEKYRFSKDHDQFERLVFQLRVDGAGAKAPAIVVKQNSGKEETEALVSVLYVSLVGAIPEATINESFSSKSQLLGPLTILSDPKSGFTLRINLKKGNTKLDAFWLQSPSRLVMDVFPENSPRAKGVKLESKAWKRIPTTSNGRKKGQSEFVCFPSKEQLNATVTYEVVTSEDTLIDKKEMKIALDGTKAHLMESEISCFPSVDQLSAKISFNPIKETAVPPMVEMSKPTPTGKDAVNSIPKSPSVSLTPQTTAAPSVNAQAPVPAPNPVKPNASPSLITNVRLAPVPAPAAAKAATPAPGTPMAVDDEDSDDEDSGAKTPPPARTTSSTSPSAPSKNALAPDLGSNASAIRNLLPPVSTGR